MAGTAPTVLIVDDDRNLRWLYQAELDSAGYRTLVAENGRQAIEIAATEAPDVVVMDIRMPEMDGLEAMGRILRDRARTRVILNTAYSCYQDDFVAWAADAYLVKSSDVEVLKAKIREVLSPGRS
jgi:CheY-like chemotaxis protein